MTWVPAEKVLQTVGAQRQVLAEQEARAQSFTQRHAQERAKLVTEQDQAVRDLGQAVLAKLDARSIAAAGHAVGLVGLASEDIPGKLEARRAWLAARLSAILKDPRYANRELLRHPRTGSLMTAIAEAESYRQPAGAVLATCQSHARFAKLWESGFGTAAFSAPWWRYSYWQDRSAAGELVALFPGKTDFAEVRDAYQRAVDEVAVFDADLARLRGEVAAGEALDREYAALYAEHKNIDARGLDHTRARIVQHLLTSDAGLVSQRLLASAPNLRLLFLRASGLSAKITYLDNIQRANLGEIAKDVAVQREKLDNVEQRTRRRWAPMPFDKYQKLAEDRRPRWDKRWQRHEKVYTTVYVYDRWDRARYYDDFLWWDLMTRGRYDGSYIPDVADFHRSHPDYTFDPTAHTAAAQHDAHDAHHAHDTGFDDGDAFAASAGIDADAGPSDAGDLQSTDAS